MQDCDRCPLRAGCTQVVWGEGELPNPVVVVAGWPGDEEDLMDRPLVGRAGENFRRLLGAAGLSGAYLTHAVKCKPGPRGPTRAETNACRAWLWAELKAASPRVVVTLGAPPASLLLNRGALAEVAGGLWPVEYMAARVAPWFSPRVVLAGGKKLEGRTARFLEEVREYGNSEEVPRVAGLPLPAE